MSKLIEAIKEDISTEELRNMVNEVNSENGDLEQYQVHDFDEYTINELFSNPFEALRSATFGEVSFNDEYFRFNGYGNIETVSEYSLNQELEEDEDNIIKTWLETCFDEYTIRGIIYSIDEEELDKLIEEYEEE